MKKYAFEIPKSPRALCVDMTERDTGSREDKFVNYMPGMPTLSSDSGRIERFLTNLFRRRGPLQRVTRDRTEK